ncbi:N-acetyltransferase [Winogradskyella forsetii]|uniref:N-acetyltransferase n=1 Tax=Winogradskyella forsetii TaxID=2686077 RepID=UPI0015B87838|nr:N-acetyltransferase [Winogradskyella forsetii]
MKNVVIRIVDLIKKRELKFMFNGISKRVYSKNKAFGLKRDLNLPFQNPNAKLDLLIRPFKSEDSAYFTMDLQNDGLIEKEIPYCYVAATTENTPCFRQWLIGSDQQDSIKEFWGETFPVLRKDELLLEGGFTIPNFRHNGIMPAAITRIIDKRRHLNVRWVITFVGIENIPSLKGIHRSGFKPYVLRTEKWFLFKRTVVFEDVPKEMIDQYSNDVIS